MRKSRNISRNYIARETLYPLVIVLRWWSLTVRHGWHLAVNVSSTSDIPPDTNTAGRLSFVHFRISSLWVVVFGDPSVSSRMFVCQPALREAIDGKKWVEDELKVVTGNVDWALNG